MEVRVINEYLFEDRDEKSFTELLRGTGRCGYHKNLAHLLSLTTIQNDMTGTTTVHAAQEY